MEENRTLNDLKTLFINAEGFGEGSGFFVKEDLIVTNIHVVAGATSVSAELRDSETNCVIKKFIVEGVKAFDAKNDLVILKIAGEGIPLPIGDSDLVQTGDIVQAIGYRNKVYKATEGPIHSIWSSDKWIRMKFKTDRGNSGGPVLNESDEVIGVVVGSKDSYSFAIPANVVKTLLAHQGQEIEPLAQWQERKQIRAHICMVQSQNKRTKSLHDKEIDDLNEAIQLYPDYALAYNNRADAKCRFGKSKDTVGNVEAAQNLYQEAMVDINTAIKLDSNIALFYHTRGEIKHAFGDYNAAIENYEKAREIDPNYTDVCKDLELAKKALEQQKIL